MSRRRSTPFAAHSDGGTIADSDEISTFDRMMAETSQRLVASGRGGLDDDRGRITIHAVTNGLIMECGSERRVYELAPGRRTRALHDVLQGVAGLIAAGIGGLEVRIDVRDTHGIDKPAQTRSARQWLSPEEVQEEFGLGLSFLEKMRTEGTGPEYSKPGARSVRYSRTAVEEWMLRNRIRTSGN